VVIATTPTPFSIADPNDPLTLDVVGFDTNAPAAIAEFVRG
jgi:60 kDa SS-A/Ro ribonucleoprotein